MDSLQPEIEARGREIFTLMSREVPSAFSQKNVVGKLMEWSMRNEALKVQLFRFVDVCRHGLKKLRHALNIGNGQAPTRSGSHRTAKVPGSHFLRGRGVRIASFILARNGAEAIPELIKMRRWPLAFTMDILGETAVSEKEAEQYQVRYLELIESLATEAENWVEIEQIDRDERGEIPRAIFPLRSRSLLANSSRRPEAALAHLAARLRIVERAKGGMFISFDMESTALKDPTLDLFKRLPR